MAPFDIKEVRDMMSDDELELDKLGDKKTVTFHSTIGEISRREGMSKQRIMNLSQEKSVCKNVENFVN